MRLTGLRPSEACMSLSIVAEQGLEGYYNSKLIALEHFRFNQFLRWTKDCYLSFISENVCEKMLDYGQPVSWNKLCSKIARAGLKVRLHELRKVWATTLHEKWHWVRIRESSKRSHFKKPLCSILLSTESRTTWNRGLNDSLTHWKPDC
jgi:hypothetical protein